MKLAEQILTKIKEDMGSNDHIRVKIGGGYHVGVHAGFDISKMTNHCDPQRFETIDNPELEAKIKVVIDGHKKEFMSKVAASLGQMKL